MDLGKKVALSKSLVVPGGEVSFESSGKTDSLQNQVSSKAIIMMKAGTGLRSRRTTRRGERESGENP
ncbi:hypothetical protein AAFF_G00016780 [Aldrovandia affinis]|uniref:Uncharacterized protein n=1 Tax=Aldrovandia affinis TaxID=143900 RepID=A0AAD7WGY4_9TELE|nr:hypothetical protein AAFF_G00016780 [Aldrovandia affinis]